MSYRIEAAEPVDAAVSRIAREQVQKVLTDLGQSDLPVQNRVHGLRQSGKKIRSLLRLVRPGFAGYKTANRQFRDIARLVSVARDARIMADLVAELAEPWCGGDAGEQPQPVAVWFRQNCKLAEQLAEPLLEELEQTMAQVATEPDRWDMADIQIEHVVVGLERTLDHVHNEMRNVHNRGDADDFHAFRKYVKYHGHHLRLLREVMGEDDHGRCDTFEELAHLVGEAHDRDVLLEKLAALPDSLKDDLVAQKVAAAVDLERHELRRKALALCDGLFEESPVDFAASVGRRWMETRESNEGQAGPLNTRSIT